MTTFMQYAACKGHRPAGVAPHRHQSRPALVARLLRDRLVPRFLVAPDGFGKSALAFEYAEVVFSFEHVFWISCTSPCFLRDLDAGTLRNDMRQIDADGALVVLEDAPLLSEERAEALSSLIDCLLEDECEVIVTTTPARDGLEHLQRDRLVLDGADLLLDDEEAARNGKGELTGQRGPFPPEARIAGLQWSDDGMGRLLRGIVQEDLPSDMMLAVWLLLALGRGTVADLARLFGDKRAEEAWEFLGARYPFLGAGTADGGFRAMAVEPAELAAAFGRRMGALARAAGSPERDELVAQVADALVERGNVARAGRLVASFAGRAAVPRWLGRRGWELLWGRAPVELCALYESVSHSKMGSRSSVNAMMAWASAQLGDGRRALEYARRALLSPEADPQARATALLAARDQGNSSVQVRTEKILRAWLEETREGQAPEPGEGSESSEAPAAAPVPAALRALVEVTLAPESLDERLKAWEEARARMEARPPATLLGLEPWLLAAAGVLEAYRPGSDGEAGEVESLETSCALDALAAFCCDAVEDRVERGVPLGFGSMRAADQLQRLDGELARRKSRTLSPPARAALRAAHIEAARAYEDYRDLRQRHGTVTTLGYVAPIRDRSQAGQAPWRDGASATLGAPLLRVHLFGTMAVRVGDRELPPHLLGRRKVRLLLALLVLHRGRDVTRDALSAMLWPQLTRGGRIKNFYKLWHSLETALSGDEPCPYLVRDRYGCRLDTALFTSDVMEFEELTRHLLFGDAPSSMGWETLYQMVKGPFSGELMPVEQEDVTICRLRERYAVELVDGLIAAARRLCRVGEPQGALWFAREALVRDPTREDAYAALMEAQMAAGQRTAALDTFFTCRAYLADTLGLDPSLQLLELYQRLLEEDPALGKIGQ